MIDVQDMIRRAAGQPRYIARGKVMEFEDAAKLVRNGSTLTCGGITHTQVPDSMLAALEIRFLTEGEPKDLTLVYPVQVGAGPNNGMERLAHEGMFRRIIAPNYYTELCPETARLVADNRVEAYMFPLGTIIHLLREISRGKSGLLTQVGLGSFVDPRSTGGKLNAMTTKDLIEVVQFAGEEHLFYKALPIDVAIIRGTTADEDGNISLEDEPLSSTVLLLAMAAKACRGKVIAQVRRVVKAGSIVPSHLVKVPGVFVDAVVVDEHQKQLEYSNVFDPRLAGLLRMPIPPQPPVPLDEDKILMRRAMLEMRRGWVVNLGARVPIQGLPLAMYEENIQDLVHISIEHGAFGGVALGSHIHLNPTGFLDSDRLFDFYHSGGFDACFLGLGEVDAEGNVNLSRLDENMTGPGGSIDISHSVPRVHFLAKFTRDGLRVKVGDGRLEILAEGRQKKFVRVLKQRTIVASERLKRGQQVKYITERGVLRLEPRGLVLEEVAPGIDVRRDILDQAEFEIFVAEQLREMDRRIFLEPPIGLRQELLQGS